MLAYQAGIAKFDASETKVFGISTDNTPSQKEFAAKNNVQFPLLSDFAKRQVSTDYGVLIVDSGVAGWVDDQLERRAVGWRIVDRQWHSAWSSGNPAVLGR